MIMYAAVGGWRWAQTNDDRAMIGGKTLRHNIERTTARVSSSHGTRRFQADGVIARDLCVQRAGLQRRSPC